jgi:hypothetical protein
VTSIQIAGFWKGVKKAPPDLTDVMGGFSARAGEWAKELEEVAPYIDYIDQRPTIAKMWNKSASNLIAKLQRLIGGVRTVKQPYFDCPDDPEMAARTIRRKFQGDRLQAFRDARDSDD